MAAPHSELANPFPANAREGTVERGDARLHREEIIQLYERAGKTQFRSLFDWYYRSEGQQTPTSWMLRDRRGSICGLCSVTIRLLQFGNTMLRAGISGNLLVDRTNGMYHGALDLVRAMKSLVTDGEIDILLGIPNALAQPVFARVGFQEIGRWQTHACLHRSRDLLRSRFGVAGTLASPLVDFCAATRRAFAGWSHTPASRLNVREIAEDELGKIPFENWVRPGDRIEAHLAPDYLKWRYLRNPADRYALAGIEASGELCGYLTLRRLPRRVWITDCAVDRHRISEADAILGFCRDHRLSGSTAWITHLRSSSLSTQLSSYGFIPVPPSAGGYPDYRLVGFWRPDHPLSETFSREDGWNLFPGCNDV